MKTEILNIFDGRGNTLGVASRDEVHEKGHWHETFHCWFVTREHGKTYILFQIRSERKKDYPSLLDISAAGHILFDETISDGIREVHEELGVDLSFEDLIPLGVIRDEIIHDSLIDSELGNVFLYVCPERIEEQLHFQEEEVSGVIKLEYHAFAKLWSGEISEVVAIDSAGEIRLVTKTEILPHSESYIETLLGQMAKELKL
ncbi:NUDIX hydrolase [Mesobacillus zeae]|uniref:NUDIX hydrolase n=1 Tax=Mesobacillus zeae TaxID=1917180 RepID=A0A398B3A6_9BACI|nr:NUDIX domain-containing protein [Mesobacillus zeae]RID84282.1 NUDIX hydrolase [Mesobacillus zeae]